MTAVRTKARGFAMITAIFLLVILGSMAAFAVTFSTNTAATHAASVQGARAYEAARAGLEWATYQVKDPNGTLAAGATNLPDCFAAKTLAVPASMGGFSVQVTCTRYPAFSASPNFHEEGGKRSAFYVVISTSTLGTVGSVDYVERRLETRVEKCKDAASSAPTYAC